MDTSVIICERYKSKGKHLCSNCKRVWDFNDWEKGYTTMDLHPCDYMYEWNYDHAVTEDELPVREDNGGGFWVIGCTHYLPWDEADQKKIYREWINGKDWKDKAKDIIKRSGYKCMVCGSAMNLCVHHITYENLCYEKDEDLMCLCKVCHERLHEKDLVQSK